MQLIEITVLPLDPMTVMLTWRTLQPINHGSSIACGRKHIWKCSNDKITTEVLKKTPLLLTQAKRPNQKGAEIYKTL